MEGTDAVDRATRIPAGDAGSPWKNGSTPCRLKRGQNAYTICGYSRHSVMNSADLSQILCGRHLRTAALAPGRSVPRSVFFQWAGRSRSFAWHHERPEGSRCGDTARDPAEATGVRVSRAVHD